MTLDLEYKVFIVHIAALSINLGDEVHPLKRTLIIYLKVYKVFTKILNKYIDFTDIFLPKLVIEFSNYIKINNYAIKLVDGWQPLYNFIYSLGLVELEKLKGYIKNNLINGFIRLFKSSIGILIFFDIK